MDHYIEIIILPDPEFKTPMLMSALFNKLHRGLVSLQADCIGVSFPNYQPKGSKVHLGNTLRLHGKVESLNGVMETNWLKGMNDHIELKPISPIPKKHELITVKRVQCKSNVERLRARRMRRLGETREQVKVEITDSVEQKLSFPYVNIKSASTKQQFKFFIRQELVNESENDKPTDGKFNCYAMSSGVTLPYF